MNNLENDFRIGIIKKDGCADIIFSSNEKECKNICHLDNNDNKISIQLFYDEIKDKTYKENDNNDKHLFYLKDYLKTNFVDEFKNIGVNPQMINDDLLLYYYLSSLGNVLVINSSEHINILITPSSNGITGKQFNQLENFITLFDNNTTWAHVPNMHIETFEQNGHKYGTLEVGDVVEGDFNAAINSCKEYIQQKRK